MSFEIVSATSEHKSDWNQYIENHEHASPYHNFAWLSSVEKAYKHQNASLLAIQNNKVVGILPAVRMAVPMAGHKLCSLPFCDVGNVVADSAHIAQSLIEHLQKKNADAKLFEYRDTQTEPGDLAVIENGPAIKVRMIMPMPDTSEELMASFKSKLRSQIRKSEKNGLTATVSSRPNQSLIDDFYQVFALNMRALGSPVHSKSWFENIIQEYKDNAVLACVYHAEIPIGGGIVLKNKHKASIPWASTVAEYNRLAPNMMLYWHLLAHCADHGISEFDFGRSTYGEGTYKFKRQWGASPVPLKWQRFCDQNAKAETSDSEGSEKSPLRSAVEKCWARLPLTITTTFGPLVRKYISL